MRTWAIDIRSEDAVRPHRLDERVLTSLAEALEADASAFDADVVGDGPHVVARFDVCAETEVAAVELARAIFLAALSRATGEARGVSRVEVRVREHAVRA